MNLNNSKKKIATNITLNNMLEYIDEHINEPITITNLADYSYLSQSRIAHMFTYNLHISVQKYINRKKMIYAHNLIKNGFKPTKVAISLGYDNYSTFYRLYKKYINANPQIKIQI